MQLSALVITWTCKSVYAYFLCLSKSMVECLNLDLYFFFLFAGIYIRLILIQMNLYWPESGTKVMRVNSSVLLPSFLWETFVHSVIIAMHTTRL